MDLVATNTASPSRLGVSTVGFSLTAFFVFSYILCVLGAVLFPGVIVHRLLEFLLPGFELLTWRSFFVGLGGSIGWAWYIALVFVPIYNFVHART
jgi:hypothetical protein